ncbi:MAG: endo-1,4-beta-xylanase [Lachnospiraceae bacterium]|nr:endo-1,4-beta-xylanase [Lachnospiraceae bacterium]
MKKKILFGILTATMIMLSGGCAGTVEVGPVPSITPRPIRISTPSVTPTPVPSEDNSNSNKKNFIEQYNETGKFPSLYETYQDYFQFGVAVTQDEIKDEKKQALIKEQFNSLTCMNELNPSDILDYEATTASGNRDRAVLDFSGADVILQFAQENNMTVRGSTLITHETPAWFFTSDFSESTGEETTSYASADVMETRMENYIKDIIEHCNTNYPGVVSCWDVLEEAIAVSEGHPLRYRVSSGWYETMGDDYIVKAYEFARKYADSTQKLFYNENEFDSPTLRLSSIALVNMLKEKNLIDGFAVQGHWNYQSPNTMTIDDVFNAASNFGIEVHISQLDINMAATQKNDLERTEEEILTTLAKRYKNIFNWLVRVEDQNTYDIANVTIYGLTDDVSWLNQPTESVDEETGETVVTVPETNYPVLFDAGLNPKDAFFGVLLDETIKLY